MYPYFKDILLRLLRNASIKVIYKPCKRVQIDKCACAARSMPPHLSSRHKAAHDAHKDTVNPAILRLHVHGGEHNGRRGDERVSCGEHAAPQEALQLKRQKVELHAKGPGRGGGLQLARALHMEEDGGVDEFEREHNLVKLLVDRGAHEPAEVTISV